MTSGSSRARERLQFSALLCLDREYLFNCVGYPFDSGSHKMLWSRESIYQEANPEVTALARRGAA